MHASRKLALAAGIFIIVGAQAVFTVILATPRGIRVHSPQPGIPLDRSFIVSGDAWSRAGLESVRVDLSPRSAVPGGVVSFTAARDAVRYRGNTLSLLSSWKASVTLPSDGEWVIRAVAASRDGSEVAAPARTVLVRAGTPVREFRSWTPGHLIPMALIVLASVGLGLAARGSPARFRTAASLLTAAMWANELTYQLYWFFTGGWSVTTALMLQMCGLSILLLPLALFSENPRTRQALFDVLYFWGIGGAIQALIAPDIGTNGFPAYRYFSFFISHGLIIASTLTVAIAGGVSITPRSFLRAFVVTNAFLLPMYGIDRLIALIPPYDPGNYFVLAYPPPTGSIVDLFSDVFGPSPRYVVGLELMGLAVFAILYAPWPMARAAIRRRSSIRDESARAQ